MLEPAGTVEIKFRRKDLVKTMHRLDTKCQVITQALASAGNRHISKIVVTWCVVYMLLSVLITFLLDVGISTALFSILVIGIVSFSHHRTSYPCLKKDHVTI